MEKYLDVYVQNENDQVGVANGLLESIFVDDICIYPKGAKYSYSTANKLGEPTFVVDNNDVYTYTTYDELGRIRRQHNAYGSTMSQMDYYTNPNWITEMNHVTSKNWVDNSSYNETRIYVDGFGKTKQVMVSDVNRDARSITETNVFNNRGQLVKSYKPYALSDATFTNRYDTDYDVKTQNLYGSYYAYTELSYLAYPEDKLSTVKPPRTNTESVISASEQDYVSPSPITHPFTNTIYGIGELLVHEVTDAEGNKTWTYLDNFQRVIREDHEIGNEHTQNADGSISDAGQGYAIAQTWFVYDGAGRIIEVIDPSGKSTTYEYNSLGVVVKSTSPDRGTSEMRYDKYGQVRFTRNSIDAAAVASNAYGTDQFSYMKYDEWGRAIEAGFMKAADSDPLTLPSPYTPTIYFDDYNYVDDQDFPSTQTPQNQIMEKFIYDGSREQLTSNSLLEDATYTDHTMNALNGIWTPGTTDKKNFLYMADGQIAKVDYSYDGLTGVHSFEPQYNDLRHADW